MFTTELQAIIETAKAHTLEFGAWGAEAHANVENRVQLDLVACVVAVSRHERALGMLAECLSVERESFHILITELLATFSRLDPQDRPAQRSSGKLPLTFDVKDVLRLAKHFLQRWPAASDPTLIALPHFICALAVKLPLTAFPSLTRLTEARVPDLISRWIAEEAGNRTLAALTKRFRSLRSVLSSSVFGQDHAIEGFIDGLFNVEVTASTDQDRRRPAGLFVLAGPPGVGKTFIAELAASHLERPFKRFDMSGYAHGHEGTGLSGTPKMYQGARPGELTEFVRDHPSAVLLFDEIEKAHYSVIQLFLQVLDGGVLQDKFTEESVQFRGTIIIFTTNVGRSLYDNENSSGVVQSNAVFQRATLLDALRSELDPNTRAPHFPAALCSRMASGWPVLFNRLDVASLARVADAEFVRVGALFEQQHKLQYTLEPEISLALVMRDGSGADARTIKAHAETFLKQEVFKACQLFSDERLGDALSAFHRIRVELDSDQTGAPWVGGVRQTDDPTVLLIAGHTVADLYTRLVGGIDWIVASNSEQAFDVLAKQDVAFIILDLCLGDGTAVGPPGIQEGTHLPTELLFDYAPLAARRYAQGQNVLNGIRSRMPDAPVYVCTSSTAVKREIDDEFLRACVRAGGARGFVSLPVASNELELEAALEAFHLRLRGIGAHLRKEQMASEMATRNEVITFETAPAIAAGSDTLLIRCRNFHSVRAARSDDVHNMITDIDRPTDRFTDVVGAVAAKDALVFLQNWLTSPKKYAALGVDPPRGVLLTGPPGSGKTMLARALAGESRCAFVAEAATNFVTKYQGSGPENIRELFARARRYAPSIVFIDEVDAIGGRRSDAKAGFTGHGEAMALNQLLVEMDGFTKCGRPVIVIAATNHPDKLDPALLRRFGRVIEVELPTRAERDSYFRNRLSLKAHSAVTDPVIERIAAQAQGLSVADLERILAEASVMAIAADGIITDDIFSEAFEKLTMGEARVGHDHLRTARHEAGHALVMCLTGSPPVYVTTVGRGNFGGYAALDVDEAKRIYTRKQLEDTICQLLAGRESECLYFGEVEGVSSGASNDIARATHLAEMMVYEFGMTEDVGPLYISPEARTNAQMADLGVKAVRKIVEEQRARAKASLAQHKVSLDRLSTALSEQGRLLKHEVLALIANEIGESLNSGVSR